MRSREILWQEGHTLHATAEEAKNETLQMLKVYEDFQKYYLAMPVIVGKKTEKEKFAGAEDTYTIEAMMWDGIALQNGTSHYFGQHFAKAFDIKFLDKDNTLKTPYQTSWGVTTRMIGGLIMTHSDNNGLVLPPRIAPTKVIIIPIGDVSEKLKEITQDLENAGITYKVDNSDKTPGFKFAEAEVKGYPIRLELGKRDLDNGFTTIVRRDTLEKIKVDDLEGLVGVIKDTMDIMQKEMYERALKRRNSMMYEASTYDEFKNIAKNKSGFIKITWCGSMECEDKIKADTGLKSRCIIGDNDTSICPVCGKKSKYDIYFAKQY